MPWNYLAFTWHERNGRHKCKLGHEREVAIVSAKTLPSWWRACSHCFLNITIQCKSTFKILISNSWFRVDFLSNSLLNDGNCSTNDNYSIIVFGIYLLKTFGWQCSQNGLVPELGFKVSFSILYWLAKSFWLSLRVYLRFPIRQWSWKLLELLERSYEFKIWFSRCLLCKSPKVSHMAVYAGALKIK